MLTPIVIELINNDVAPAIPTCSFPDGSTTGPGLTDGAADDEEDETKAPADPWAVIRKALEESFATLDLPDSMNVEDLIDASLAD